MTRHPLLPVFVLTLAFAVPAHAEVKKEERNRVSFAGALGRVFNLFGGKAAREGTVSTVAVSADRKMTTTGENEGEIIDLREEKIYELDLRRKTYKVTTFEALRRQMREAEAKARESAARQSKENQGKKEEPPPNQGKEMEIDFDVKNTGQTKAINGFDTRQVVATVTVREKGKKLEESGGIVMTVDTWLTKTVSLKEIADFDRRYYEKLLAGTPSPVDAQQMATAMAMFPGLKEGFARLSREDFGGTAIQSSTTIDAVQSAEQVKEQGKEQGSASQDDSGRSSPPSIGGAIGGFMRRKQQAKEQEKEKEQGTPANANPGRSTIMTINNEVLKIATNVTAADVALPTGFKEQN